MSVPIITKRGSNASDNASIHAPQPTTADALYNFRLLAALRSDDLDSVKPFLDELQTIKDASERKQKTGAFLGMSVRVASATTISLILGSPAVVDPNVPVTPGSTTTALHVASEIGRADAEPVQLLLADPRINDTIRDASGRTPLECAANHEISALIEDSRTSLQLRFLAQLAGYLGGPLNSPDESQAMAAFLESPRIEIVNLNALDEKSGTGLLHEAARRRDLRLVELAVKKGADVFVRDKKGRRVLDGEKGGDERIKVFLRQFTNQDNSVQPKADGRPPDLTGYLSKWVNYRSGWRTRWFVLEDGVLSYYRNKEDESIACRGSIAMAVASIHPSTDGSRFEVSSRVHSSAPKMIVKSSHRAEIARWIQTIKLNIDHYSKADRTSSNESKVKVKRTLSTNAGVPMTTSQVSTLPSTDTFLNPSIQRSTTALSALSIVPPANTKKRGVSPARTAGTEEEADTISIFEATDNNSVVGAGENQVSTQGAPHENTFDMGVLNIKAQIDLTLQLIDSIVTTVPPTSSPGKLVRTPSRQQDVKDALRSSLSTLANMVSQQNIMSQNRERYYLNRIGREVEARKLWEENLLTVAKQQAETDEQLVSAARDNEKKRKALRQARGVLAGLGANASLPTSPTGDSAPPTSISATAGILDNALASPPVSGVPPVGLGSFDHRASIANIQEVHDALVAADPDSDDEDADEFFDAIEQNTFTNLSMHDSIANPDRERPGTPQSAAPSSAEAPKAKSETPVATNESTGAPTIKTLLARQSLEPYLHVRHKLPIDDDKRPSVSLWSILKSSVGKDLTKISFPVSFNECTSMLQRMAEDMEYDACLTVAAGEQDSLKRIAFVAAFAMSNYSSTIGRIAKPFNPLLSQSFEYAIPNRYRYISEQVSHHPPISACYCEAPTWKYFGEVDAQNKFQGRSFEIRPTGVAHAELVIPKARVREGLEYPDAGTEYGPGKVVEHYSWKKVTTNVSNFIMGNPIIDHYGDLRVSETCTLTFKPRSWRGKDAFEIRGSVSDSAGNRAWDIAGRWDSQLVARRAESSSPLDVDTQFGESQKEYLLLWRNSEKPKAPFNLTPYACTLNDIPSGLETYLCPTDCRLRTDQRAFENAEYDRAQGLKTANEEKQRITRKLRAEGKLPPHEPRWFASTTDQDSHERLWEPRRSDSGEVLFWSEREKAGQAGGWKGIDHIFAED